MSFLLALLLDLQEDPAALVERLGSDRVDERDHASRALKTLGAAALPELGRHADHSDPEVRARVRSLLRVLRIRESLPPPLLAALPGVEDLLARGSWRSALEASDRKGPLGPKEQGALATRALESAVGNGELSAFCDVVLGLDYRPALAALRSLQFNGSENVRAPVHRTLVEFARRAARNGYQILELRMAIPVDSTVRLFGHQIGTLNSVPVVRAVRLAMIEGKVYEEGDVLADFGVRIHRIGAHGIELRALDAPPQPR